jgi:hypothetical protein
MDPLQPHFSRARTAHLAVRAPIFFPRTGSNITDCITPDFAFREVFEYKFRTDEALLHADFSRRFQYWHCFERGWAW